MQYIELASEQTNAECARKGLALGVYARISSYLLLTRRHWRVRRIHRYSTVLLSFRENSLSAIESPFCIWSTITNIIFSTAINAKVIEFVSIRLDILHM